MSFKIAVLGAGSVGFTRNQLTNILSVAEHEDRESAFYDINGHNLDFVHQLCAQEIPEVAEPNALLLTHSTNQANTEGIQSMSLLQC